MIRVLTSSEIQRVTKYTPFPPLCLREDAEGHHLMVLLLFEATRKKYLNKRVYLKSDTGILRDLLIGTPGYYFKNDLSYTILARFHFDRPHGPALTAMFFDEMVSIYGTQTDDPLSFLVNVLPECVATL